MLGFPYRQLSGIIFIKEFVLLIKNWRIFFVTAFLLLGFSAFCVAEELHPKYRSMAERIGERRTRQIMRNLAPESKLITKDTYVNRKLTRGERREIRKDKKKGIYKSPAEEFDLMDKNKDGMVEAQEMNGYYIERARLRYE